MGYVVVDAFRSLFVQLTLNKTIALSCVVVFDIYMCVFMWWHSSSKEVMSHQRNAQGNAAVCVCVCVYKYKHLKMCVCACTRLTQYVCLWLCVCVCEFVNCFVQISHLSDRKSISYLQFVLAAIGPVWVDLSSSEPIRSPQWTTDWSCDLRVCIVSQTGAALFSTCMYLGICISDDFNDVCARMCAIARAFLQWKSIKRRKKRACLW